MTSRARLRLHQNKCQKSSKTATETRYQCDICKQSFRKQTSLKKHKEESHVNKFSSQVILSASTKSKSDAKKNATSDIIEVELSDDDCVNLDNSSDIEPLDEEYLTLKFFPYFFYS